MLVDSDLIALRVRFILEESYEFACAADLRFGAEKSGSAKLADQVDLILSAIEILPLETPADREYGKLRHDLARNGTPIGPNDLLIAAHAICAGLIVVTANTGEFSRVPGLIVENGLT